MKNRNSCKKYKVFSSVLPLEHGGTFEEALARRFVSSSAHLQVLDFREMPSPRGFPILGTAFSLIMAGGYTKLHEYIDKRHKELGPVFKDNVGPVTAVFLSDPEEMRKVFAKEGKFNAYNLFISLNSFTLKRSITCQLKETEKCLFF